MSARSTATARRSACSSDGDGPARAVALGWRRRACRLQTADRATSDERWSSSRRTKSAGGRGARARGSTTSTSAACGPRPTISSATIPREVAALRRTRSRPTSPGERARHRLQRRLLLDRDEAARRRRACSASTSTTLPGAGALRRRGDRARHRVPPAVGLRRRRRSASASTSCSSWACSTTCATRCSRSTSSTSTSPATCWSSSRCSAAADEVDAGRRRLPRSARRDHVRRARLSRSCTSSSTATPTTRPTGGSPNRACAEAMLRSAGFAILAHPEEEVYLCRRAPSAARTGAGAGLSRREGARRMIEAAMIWNEPNNKSHWDLELDPDWATLRRDGDRWPAQAIARGEPGPAARARRHVADRPALHPAA